MFEHVYKQLTLSKCQLNVKYIFLSSVGIEAGMKHHFGRKYVLFEGTAGF